MSLSTSHTLNAVAPISAPTGFLKPGDALWVEKGAYTLYEHPETIIQADDAASVTGALNEIDRLVAEGFTAVGGLSFEAAPAFDEAFQVHQQTEVPAAWFGVYSSGRSVAFPEHNLRDSELPTWKSQSDQKHFDQKIGRIKNYIEAGDTYQINYTYPLKADGIADPLQWALNRLAHSRVQYGGILHLGSHLVVSLSPELFFEVNGDTLTTCPMKGTAPRGRYRAEDDANRDGLKHSEKDRAENIMIVDLLRNDMGKISKTGSVDVLSTFDVNPFDAVWQMTSTIESKTAASIPEIFSALFPSGSVTGAPKIRSMEIIHELEDQSRGMYCGSIGCWKPNRRAVFNVAIRTATIDLCASTGVYPVGAGITWGSEVESEYKECQMKAEVLRGQKPEFQLFESLLWDDEFYLLDRHLRRLERAAAFFDFPFDEEAILRKLKMDIAEFDRQARKIRVLLDRYGNLTVESEPVQTPGVHRVGIAHQSIDETSVFLRYKTTSRKSYEEAKAGFETYDDVLLWNSKRELTESTRANVVVQIDGVKYTPPVDCGLLGGTFREELLERGEITERVLKIDELQVAEKIWCINSVRQWIDIEVEFQN